MQSRFIAVVALILVLLVLSPLSAVAIPISEISIYSDWVLDSGATQDIVDDALVVTAGPEDSFTARVDFTSMIPDQMYCLRYLATVAPIVAPNRTSNSRVKAYGTMLSDSMNQGRACKNVPIVTSDTLDLEDREIVKHCKYKYSGTTDRSMSLKVSTPAPDSKLTLYSISFNVGECAPRPEIWSLGVTFACLALFIVGIIFAANKYRHVPGARYIIFVGMWINALDFATDLKFFFEMRRRSFDSLQQWCLISMVVAAVSNLLSNAFLFRAELSRPNFRTWAKNNIAVVTCFLILSLVCGPRALEFSASKIGNCDATSAPWARDRILTMRSLVVLPLLLEDLPQIILTNIFVHLSGGYDAVTLLSVTLSSTAITFGLVQCFVTFSVLEKPGGGLRDFSETPKRASSNQSSSSVAIKKLLNKKAPACCCKCLGRLSQCRIRVIKFLDRRTTANILFVLLGIAMGIIIGYPSGMHETCTELGK